MKNIPISESGDYEKIQKQKREMAEKLSGKTEVLTKVARQYKPKKQEAECDLARDIFREALEEYEKGDLKWSEFVSELNQSLKALKKEK